MSFIVLNRSGILHEDKKKGSITAFYIPAYDQIRSFSDITQINARQVQLRYGETAQKVLWRQNNSQVTVYGTLRSELANRRQGVEVYLPQDFAPPDSDVFYYVVSSKVLIHGVRQRSEDGQETWGISQLKVPAKELEEFIETAIAERQLQSSNENICVAVKDNEQLLQGLRRRLEIYGIRVVEFIALSRRKGTTPLYMHRDYSLLMLSLTLFALLMLIATIVYLVLSVLRLNVLNEDIARLAEQIRRIQLDSPLTGVNDPERVLEEIKAPVPIPPSAVVHSAADVANEFGELQEITFQNTPPPEFGSNAGQLEVRVALNQFENDLLVHQEELADAVVRERPWVRQISRPPAQNTLFLQLQLVGEENE